MINQEDARELTVIFRRLEELETAKGTNAKKELLFDMLQRYPRSETYLRLVYNDTVWGVSTRSFEKTVDYNESVDGMYFDAGELMKSKAKDMDSIDWTDFILLLEDVELQTGNIQLVVLEKIRRLNGLHAKWITRLILKDLKVGVSIKSINKVLEQLGKKKIEKFEVQLCDKFDGIDDPKISKIITYPCLAAIKYDGLRGDLVKKGPLVTFTSRNGKVIDYVPELIEYFKKFPIDFHLDGEILCKDFSTLQKRIGRKLDNIEPVEGLHFRQFDILEWNNKSLKEVPQYERTEAMRQLIKESDLHKIEEHIMCKDLPTLKEFYKMACDRKEEGIIIKILDRPYDSGSRKNWYKVKPIFENTFVIKDKKNGTGKNSEVISRLYIEDLSGEITSWVGSGLTDNDILLLMNLDRAKKLIGTCVDIKYNEITVDKAGDRSLRFPRVLKIRLDKDKPDKITIS